MIIQITHHDVRDHMLEAALARISTLTASMSQQTGFLFRHVGRDTERALRVTTVTAWRDAASFKDWEEASKTVPLPVGDVEKIYARVEVSRIETDIIR